MVRLRGPRSLMADCWLLIALLSFIPVTRAEVPHLIRYQGQAVDSQGVPLEGPYALTFRLYDAETVGTVVWEETQGNVQLTGGHFSILLGQVTPLNTMDWSRPCWLAVQVNAEPELSPRQRITSVPLAITAERLAVPVTTSTIEDDANALVPAGAILLWTGTACPVGYSRLTTMDGKFLVSDASFDPSAGGSNTHDHGGSTGSHALTIAEMPSHTHTSSFRNANGWGGSANYVQPSNESSSAGTHTTGAAGGGQGHSHPIASVDHRPEFATLLLCHKD